MKAPKIGDEITVIVSRLDSVKTHKARVRSLPQDKPVIDGKTMLQAWIVDALLVLDEHETTVTVSNVPLFENHASANHFLIIAGIFGRQIESEHYKLQGFFVVAFWPDEDGKQ